jgi:hypothetical protein
MSLGGKWRIMEMSDFEADYPDMVEPAYILFEEKGGGEFAFGCCAGHIWQASSTEAASIEFSWTGNDEMDEVSGDGSAELQPDGSSMAKSVTTMATTGRSSPRSGPLQQLARHSAMP